MTSWSVRRLGYASGLDRLPWRSAVSYALLLLCFAVFAARAQASTLVSLNFTNFGSVQLDLFDDLVPTTVNNFVQNYVATGLYNDSMIHRVDTGLGVIQGGGFTSAGAAIATSPPIALEYNRANTRGTISMARTGATNTNTATSQWFINTDDNTTDLGASNAGGYAVFGWVVGPGMQVVDNIAAVPTFAYAQPFNQVPLQNFTTDDFNGGANPIPHAVVLSSATVVKTHASFQNPFLAADVNNSNSVTATDALSIINDLLLHRSHAISGPFAGTDYLDPTGDGRVTAADALLVISALLHPTAQASPLASPFAGPAASPMVIVPEPSSFVLGGFAVIGLLVASRSIRRKRNRAGQ
jgi:peptidyl-prolyl cis-trans isomerase A (cyclophilin A)